MTLDELDRLLAQWKVRLDTSAASLSELRSRTACDILAGTQRLQLTGATAQKLGGPLAALDSVWTDYAALCSSVDRAGDLRKSISRFTMSPDKLREAESILTGPVAVPNAGSVNELLASAGQSMTLDQLLARMDRAFIAGRDALMEIDSTWTYLNAQLSPVSAFLDANRSETAAGMQEFRAAVDAIRPQVMADPLGARAQLDTQVLPVYNRVKAAVEKLTEQRQNFPGNLQRARALLASASALYAESRSTFDEFREKIAGRRPTEPAFDPHRMYELEAQLTRIGNNSGSDVDSACTMLEHCLNDLRELIVNEERAIAQNRGPLDLRRELRGRLSAFKARAVARHKAEDAKLTEIARRADELLHSRPTPIDEAATLVTEYGRASL